MRDRVHPDGPIFRYPDGQRYRWAHVTAFSALGDWLSGDYVRLQQYAAWTRAIGANGWRVFGGWQRTGLDFRQKPHYFSELQNLTNWLADEKLRLEFTAICDYIPRELNEENDFLALVANALKPCPNAFLEGSNEGYKNSADAAQFIVPRDVLFCRSAYDPVLMPAGAAYASFHSPRDAESHRKGKDLREAYYDYPGTHCPVVDNEPTRVDLFGADQVKWWEMGCTRGLFGAGATFHGGANTLQLCQVPTGDEDACARQFFAGLFAPPDESPNWQYGRYGEAAPATPHVIADSPGALRVYEMTGGTHACGLVIDGGPAVGINGWRVAKTDGPNGCFVTLER